MAIMMDNASNNDTLVESLVRRAAAEGIFLDGKMIRLCCMPHTTHLVALKVREMTVDP